MTIADSFTVSISTKITLSFFDSAEWNSVSIGKRSALEKRGVNLNLYEIVKVLRVYNISQI